MHKPVATGATRRFSNYHLEIAKFYADRWVSLDCYIQSLSRFFVCFFKSQSPCVYYTDEFITELCLITSLQSVSIIGMENDHAIVNKCSVNARHIIIFRHAYLIREKQNRFFCPIYLVIKVRVLYICDLRREYGDERHLIVKYRKYLAQNQRKPLWD